MPAEEDVYKRQRLAGSDDVGDEGALVAAQGAGHRVLLMRLSLIHI